MVIAQKEITAHVPVVGMVMHVINLTVLLLVIAADVALASHLTPVAASLDLMVWRAMKLQSPMITYQFSTFQNFLLQCR